MKKRNKGFTLAELLIVVAVIAVLVAIAIPTFAAQLEKSRQSVDVSNLRAAYSAAKTEAMTMPASETTRTLYYDPKTSKLEESAGTAYKKGTGAQIADLFAELNKHKDVTWTYPGNTSVIKVVITRGADANLSYAIGFN